MVTWTHSGWPDRTSIRRLKMLKRYIEPDWSVIQAQTTLQLCGVPSEPSQKGNSATLMDYLMISKLSTPGLRDPLLRHCLLR